MKDSGIEWIGEIPKEWDVIKTLRALNMPITDGPHETPELYDSGIPFVSAEAVSCGNGTIDFNHIRGYISNEYYEECCKKYIPKNNDILMIKSGATTGKVAMVNTDIIFTIWSPLGVFRCNPQIYNCRFMFFFLQSDAYQKQIENKWTFGTQQNIGMRTLEQLMLCVPPLPEQERIATFLDSECARIDEVISKTKSTIEEYKKLKQSVITEAVTKGIRPNREMKDSGIEWIGEIPKEWEISLLKYSIRWKSEKGQPNATVLSLYRDYGVIPKDSRDDNHNVTSLDTSSYKVVAVGDFVINKMKAWQGSMAVSEYEGIVSPAYHVCEITNKNISKKYFHHLLRNHLYLPEYARLSTGMRIGQWDLGFDDFKNIPFIIPSLEEQEEIVEYIENGLSQYDTLIAKKEQIVSELESYKKSLIYEYVTGKKEVV